jgi:anti-sigma-K factor RskA
LEPETRKLMAAHEQFADDLALLALGSLQDHERAALEKHLEDCPGCRLELDQLRGDMALMALSAGGPRPPVRARQRLMDAIAHEPQRAEKARKAATRPSWWRAATLLVTAAGALVILLLVRQDTILIHQAQSLAQQVVGLQSDSLAHQAEIANARAIVSTLTSPDALRVTLVAAKTPPRPQGKAIYVRDRSSLIFLASNLPPLPSEKIYELWLIPESGPPVAAGLFKPDAHGSATVVNPPLPAGVAAKTFVVTLEPQSGSHDAPRGSAVISGQGE